MAMREPSLLADAATRAQRYLDGLPDRPVAPSPQALAALAQLDLPLPDGPSDPAGILDRLDRIDSPATVAMAGLASGITIWMTYRM